MSALGVLADEYGLDGVQEAALATQRSDAATVLEREIEVARNSAIQMTSPVPAEAIQTDAASGHEPWQLGEAAAGQLRDHIGRPTEPLRNRALSDVVGFDVAGKIRLARRDARYGLRLRDRREDLHRVSLSTSRPPSRRFEICRASWRRLLVRRRPAGSPLGCELRAAEVPARIRAESAVPRREPSCVLAQGSAPMPTTWKPPRATFMCRSG